MDDVLKKVDDLTKRVKELESQKKSNYNFSGRSYSQVGESSSDFLIKTRGQVKIQWGNKFIDLIKDGKINVDADFIFKSNKIGSKAGIYVLDDGTIWIKVSGMEAIPVVSNEIGTTYVSFIGEQITSSEMKHQALVNIGFLYPNLSSVDSNSLQNGIIYVESEHKLYIVADGTLSEFKIDFPNPFNEQFIIAKNDNKQGALLIKGDGIENALAFEQVFIYSDSESLIFESSINILFEILGINILNLTDSSASFGVKVESDSFQSKGASSTSGFRLYLVEEESTLEVDNLIVRNKDATELTPLYPEYWLLKNNIIVSCVTQSESTGGSEEVIPRDDDVEETDYSEFDIQLAYASDIKVGDILCVYKSAQEDVAGTEDDDSTTQVFVTPIRLEVTAVADEVSISVKGDTSLSKDDLVSLSGAFIFLVKRENENPIRIKSNNVDIVEYKDDLENPTVKARFGDLTDLELKETDNTPSEETQVPVQGSGTYSEQGVFKHAAYISGYELDDNDNSSKLASTEWVRKFLKDTLDRLTTLENKVGDLEGRVAALETV